MVARARSEIVKQGEIAVYHTWSRCVQRAFLFGEDPETKLDFGERREAFEGLIKYQTGVFAMDLGNYSLLSNHFHLIVRTRPDVVRRWSDEEVATRWRLAWPSWNKERRCWERVPEDLLINDVLRDPEWLEFARQALGSLSWFMARVKEPMSRLLNLWNDKSGYAWEARFGSRLIESAEHLFACSVYVDLNQLKAGLVESLDESEYAAIRYRMQAAEIAALRRREAEASVKKFAKEANEFQSLSVEEAEALYAGSHLSPICSDGMLLTTEVIANEEAAESLGAAESLAEADMEAEVVHGEMIPEAETQKVGDTAKESVDWKRRLEETIGMIEIRIPSTLTTVSGRIKTYEIVQRVFPRGIPARSSSSPLIGMPIDDYVRLVMQAAKFYVEVERPGQWEQELREQLDWESRDAARDERTGREGFGEDTEEVSSVAGLQRRTIQLRRENEIYRRARKAMERLPKGVPNLFEWFDGEGTREPPGE